jgi:hypothetical protein
MDYDKFKGAVFLIKDIYGKEFRLDINELVIKQSGPSYVVKRGDKEVIIRQMLIDDKLSIDIKNELSKLV